MAERVDSTLTVRRAPLAYSFCASMIRRVLSAGVAVDGVTPMRERKEDGDIVGVAVAVRVVVCVLNFRGCVCGVR